MLGKLGHFLDKSGNCEVWDKIASEGARTVPGRENGGNCDMILRIFLADALFGFLCSFPGPF